MAQKLKGTGQDGKFGQVVMNSAHQIWLAGLGAFARAQAEGSKMFDSLVKEGEAVQSRAGKVASAQMERLSKNAAGSWDKLEQVFEERVSKSLNKLGVPSYGDIQALSKHVNELNTNVRMLVKQSKGGAGKRGGKAASKPGKEASPSA
ncbi:MAG TPA: phasin family protein [Burkholderiales bacterium]|nr:phasin family protein [Burkholderiales bacterium]